MMSHIVEKKVHQQNYNCYVDHYNLKSSELHSTFNLKWKLFWVSGLTLRYI